MAVKYKYPLRKLHTARSHHTDAALLRIFDQGSTAICIVTQTGRKVVYVNPVFLQLTGYKLEEIIGHHAQDFILQETAEKTWMIASALREKGSVQGEKIRVRCQSGQVLPVLIYLDTVQLNHMVCVLIMMVGLGEKANPLETLSRLNEELEGQVKERTSQLVQLNRSLLETRLQQKAIFDNIPDMAWLKDTNGHFLAVNSTFAQACGMTPEAVVGKTDRDVWPADLAERYQRDDDEVIRIGRMKRIEEPIKDVSGQLRWIETIKAPIFNENGEITGTTGIARDISQRRQVDEIRQRNKGELEQIILERTRELAQTNQNLTAEVQKHERTNIIQTAVYQIAQAANLSDSLGGLFKSIHQILGTLMPVQNFFIALYDRETKIISFPYFVDEHDPQPPSQGIDHGVTAYVLRTGNPLLASPDVFDRLVKEGQVDNVGAPSIDWLGVPLATKNAIIGVLAVQSYQPETRFTEEEKDILVFVSSQIAMAIDRVRTEEGLRESEARYRAVVEDQTDLICRYLSDGTMVFVNQALANFYGQEREALIGRPYFPLLPADEQERSKTRLARMKLDHQQLTTEQLNILPDGETRWISWSDRALFDEDGNFREYQSVGHDITAQKLRQRELEAIVTITTALRSAQNQAEMAPIILDQLMGILGVSGAALAVFDHTHEKLLVELGRGVWENSTGARINLEGSLADMVFRLGHAYAFPSASGEILPAAFELGAGQPCIACIPLVTQDEPTGVIWVGRRPPFNANDLHLLIAISDITANAFNRSSLHEQTQKQLQRLITLRAIDMAISANLDLNATLNILVEQIVNQLGIHAAILFKYDPAVQLLKIAAGSGVKPQNYRGITLKLGDSHAGQIAQSRVMQFIPDLDQINDGLTADLKRMGLNYKSYIGLPLVAKGQIKGVLELYNQAALVLDEDWLDYLEAIASQAAIAIDGAELLEKLQKSNEDLSQAYDATIESWARALEIRDKETEEHTRRVVELTLNLMDAMGEDGLEKDQVRRGSLLHDIGKMAIPDSILLKPGPLDEDEWKIMRQHPSYAYELLLPIGYLHNALDIPYCHHEKWDGSGYPRGLKGEQIPLAARIFSIVDVWDALNSDRPYSAAWAKKDVIAYIKDQSGKQFDPRVVSAFLDYLQKNLSDN